MAKYSSGINGVALSATFMRSWLAPAITSPGGTTRVYEVFLAGEAGASNNFRVGINRPSNAGTTPGGALAAEKLHPAAPTAGVLIYTSYAVAPTLNANDVALIAFNGYGGAIRWTAPVDGEIWLIAGVAQGLLVMASRNGTGNVSGHVMHEEL